MNPSEAAALVGSFLPPFIAVLQQSSWSAAKKHVVALIVSLIAAFITTYATGTLKVGNWTDVSWLFSDFALVWGAGQITYHGLWKPSQIAPAIESATNIPPRKVVYVSVPAAPVHQVVAPVVVAPTPATSSTDVPAEAAPAPQQG